MAIAAFAHPPSPFPVHVHPTFLLSAIVETWVSRVTSSLSHAKFGFRTGHLASDWGSASMARR